MLNSETTQRSNLSLKPKEKVLFYTSIFKNKILNIVMDIERIIFTCKVIKYNRFGMK